MTLGSEDYSTCMVLYPLKVGCHIMSITKQQWVTVVNPWQNKSWYKCCSYSTCQESIKDVKRHSSRQHVRAKLETCAFILRWQSNARPRFFADCLKGVWAFPIVIEVGRIWRCLAVLEVVSESSVYLSFNLSMFVVDQLWHYIYKTT